MSEMYQRLAHSSWDCKYHVVFVAIAAAQGAVWPGTAQVGRSTSRIGAAEGVPDHGGTPAAGPCAHVHGDPSEVSGGLSDRISERARLCGKERNFTGEHFWARGYAVSTVGFELEQVRKYIREQEAADGNSGSF